MSYVDADVCMGKIQLQLGPKALEHKVQHVSWLLVLCKGHWKAQATKSMEKHIYDIRFFNAYIRN